MTLEQQLAIFINSFSWKNVSSVWRAEVSGGNQGFAVEYLIMHTAGPRVGLCTMRSYAAIESSHESMHDHK